MEWRIWLEKVTNPLLEFERIYNYFLQRFGFTSFFRGEGKQSHENPKNRRKCEQENVLHQYYDEENSRSENPASWEIVGV